MAKVPMYKGKSISSNNQVVGRLLIEDRNTYFIMNDDVDIKEQIVLKSLSTATKKEYDNFVKMILSQNSINNKKENKYEK